MTSLLVMIGESNSEALVGRSGDEDAGFVVTVDIANRILHTRAWGFFSIELGVAYRKAMMEGMDRLRGGSWAVLSDRRKMKPQRDEVLELMSEIMTHATSHGRTHAAVIVDSSIAGMQMRRLANETHANQKQFTDELSARAWLKTLGLGGKRP